MIVEVGDNGQNVLRDPYAHAGVSLFKLPGVQPLHLFGGQPFGIQLVEALDAVVDGFDFVPGGLAHDAVHRQVENPLKFPHGSLGFHTKKTVDDRQTGDGRVVIGDAVELPLDNAHILPRAAQAKRRAGIGAFDARHRGVEDDVDIVAVIPLQDFIGYQALLGQGDGAPLRQALAGGGGAAAVLGEIGLHASPAGRRNR